MVFFPKDRRKSANLVLVCFATIVTHSQIPTWVREKSDQGDPVYQRRVADYFSRDQRSPRL